MAGPLAAGGRGDGRVSLWEVLSGRAIGVVGERFVGTVGPAFVAISPDGGTIAVGAFETLTLWDRGSGRRIARFPGHQGNIKAVAFSPDGKTLAGTGGRNIVLRSPRARAARRPRRIRGKTR
jgi:WD40 repeat protein